MDALVLVLAILANALDVGVSCHRIRHGARELNPLLGDTCRQIALTKAAFFAPVPFLPRHYRRIYLGALAVSGGVGVAVSLRLRD